MATFQRFSTRKGFFLTEEALVRISDIAKRRFEENGRTATVHFRVQRKDGMLIEYHSPTDVAAEENAPRNAITRVEIASKTETGELRITFDAKDGLDLFVKSETRDVAFLMTSDLKEYFASEVLRFRAFSLTQLLDKRATFPLLMIAALAIMFTLMQSHEYVSKDKIKVAIESNDIAEKLNFLLQDRFQRTSIPISFMSGFLSIPLIFLLSPFIEAVFPRNIFYWGKAAIAHERTKAIRDKAFWGIVVAAVVGIGSTIAVEWLKK